MEPLVVSAIAMIVLFVLFAAALYTTLKYGKHRRKAVSIMNKAKLIAYCIPLIVSVLLTAVFHQELREYLVAPMWSVGFGVIAFVILFDVFESRKAGRSEGDEMQLRWLWGSAQGVMYRERVKSAVVIGLIWGAAVAAVAIASWDEHHGLGSLMWLIFPLVIMVVGLLTYVGHRKMMIGYKTRTKEEQDKYDLRLASSCVGIFFVIFSFLMFLMDLRPFTIGIWIVWVTAIIAAAWFIFMFAYVYPKTFKADKART